LRKVVALTPELIYKKIKMEKKFTISRNKNKQEEKMDKESKVLRVSNREEKEKKDQTILTPLEDYIKTAAYLGTKVITPTMRKYVYRRRLDGLAILNTLLVDKKLSEGINFIKQFKPNEWIIVCKRESGWRAAEIFSKLTGVRLFTKKYPSGILTNTNLDNFIETKMLFICDPWIDKNSLEDAKKVRIPVIGICDTNNHTTDLDLVIIGNNKSNKSLGLFFWLMAREYIKFHKLSKKVPSLEEFVGEELILEEPKKKRLLREKKEKELKTEESAIEEKMREIAEKADEEAKEEMEEELEEKEAFKASKAPEEGV
tara:strand:+ start:30393 stop:31334 length:942 start_codon:yes stop_codon:yes gene_type:complete